MQVSVIIPVRDGERFLGTALDCALAQTHPDVELVVVDDGSTDASATLARRRGVRVLTQEPRGIAAARNAGLRATSGAAVAILDADDEWPVDRLARQVAHLEAHPGLGMVLGLADVFLEPGTQRPAWWPTGWGTVPLRGHPSSALIRRTTYDAVGAYDESFSVAEDTDWLARAAAAGIASATLEHVVLRYRQHGANVTWQRDRARSEVFRALRGAAAARRRPA